MKNESLPIILDNIHVLQVRESLNSYSKLSKFVGINENTIKSWFSSKKVHPRLRNLDTLCDKFHVHTSDLFKPASIFEHPYCNINNSHEVFKKNFATLCLEIKLFSINEILDYIDSTITYDVYISYMRSKNGRSITIETLDRIADKFNLATYMLLK